MNFDTIISCDPGLSNGAFAIFRNGKVDIKPISKLKTVTGITTILKYYKEISENVIVFIEKTDNIYLGDIKSNPFKVMVMQKLVKHYTELKIILFGLGIPTIEVDPKTWQVYLRLKKVGYESEENGIKIKKLKSELKQRKNKFKLKELEKLLLAEKNLRKKRYKKAAQNFYPEIRATLVNQDALCLLQYGRLKLVREPDEIQNILNSQ